MRNLLTGNGINIQFDNKNYSTQQIVLRILKNCDRDDFPLHIIVNESYLLKNYIGLLFLEIPNIINGVYAFIVSFMLIYLYEKYKTLKAPILMHIFLNITIILLLPLIIKNYIAFNLYLLTVSTLILFILKKVIKNS